MDGAGAVRQGLAIIAALAALLLVAPLDAQAPPPAPSPSAGEYELKAAYVIRMGRYVEWPDARSSGEFQVCVTGTDPFGPLLAREAGGQQIGGRPIVIRRVPRARDARRCHVLYVGPASAQEDLDEVLSAVRDADVLTISDQSRFAVRGGMVQFVPRDGRVRFEVNLDAVRNAGLRMSADLLDAAVSVRRSR